MAHSSSPLADALNRVGDRWSLLLIDALLDGPARFVDLASLVEGIAPNILTQRLRRLEEVGVVLSVPYSVHPPRFEYRLSEDGQGLAGVLRLLASWGSSDASVSHGPHHATCGTALEARLYCPTCARAVEGEEDSDLRSL
jgi:DNA-binding HxlR family transcriptional regulator